MQRNTTYFASGAGSTLLTISSSLTPFYLAMALQPSTLRTD